MGKTKGINNAEFEVGSEVKIADRAFLEAFLEAGQYHNELEPEQLAYRRQNRQSEGRRFLHRRRRDLHAARHSRRVARGMSQRRLAVPRGNWLQ